MEGTSRTGGFGAKPIGDVPKQIDQLVQYYKTAIKVALVALGVLALIGIVSHFLPAIFPHLSLNNTAIFYLSAGATGGAGGIGLILTGVLLDYFFSEKRKPPGPPSLPPSEGGRVEATPPATAAPPKPTSLSESLILHKNTSPRELDQKYHLQTGTTTDGEFGSSQTEGKLDPVDTFDVHFRKFSSKLRLLCDPLVWTEELRNLQAPLRVALVDLYREGNLSNATLKEALKEAFNNLKEKLAVSKDVRAISKNMEGVACIIEVNGVIYSASVGTCDVIRYEDEYAETVIFANGAFWNNLPANVILNEGVPTLQGAGFFSPDQVAARLYVAAQELGSVDPSEHPMSIGVLNVPKQKPS